MKNPKIRVDDETYREASRKRQVSSNTGLSTPRGKRERGH